METRKSKSRRGSCREYESNVDAARNAPLYLMLPNLKLVPAAAMKQATSKPATQASGKPASQASLWSYGGTGRGEDCRPSQD